ncbi:MAG: HlyD family efflux transporter periplasmic adaptor subunit, partial [Solirubrobacterales bacterium]|nr:HlyD family efflux transporter periplasmic adaptor subunit [Solirubrobacterales bacterium]
MAPTRPRSRIRSAWPLLLIALAAVGVAVAAALTLGPPTRSSRRSHEIVTAANGVVQSTVSGSGNVEPSTDDTVNFQTTGTLQNIDVKVGQHVAAGQLLATLDPSAAQATLDQAQQSLTAAQDQLTSAQDAQAAATTSTSTTSTTSGSGSASSSPSSSAGASSSPSSPGSGATSGSGSGSKTATTTPTTTTTQDTAATQASQAGAVASAQASVDGAQANVTSAQKVLDETRLYAPASGTVASLESISPGEAVSGTSSGNSGASSGSGSSSSGGGGSGAGSSGSSSGSGASSGSSSGSGGSSAGAGSSTAGSLGSASGSSSTSGGLVEIVNTRPLTMVVPLSESDIAQVRVGQAATVTMEALTGVELAAHVSSVSTVGTESSGVVSYDVTLTLDQGNPQVKPGMSAEASIITAQRSGVNVPSSAVSTSGGTATVQQDENGRTVSTPVVTGITGDSRTIIASGLRAGDQVIVTETLPALGTSTTSSSAGSSGTLGGGRGFGGGGFGGGGFGG